MVNRPRRISVIWPSASSRQPRGVTIIQTPTISLKVRRLEFAAGVRVLARYQMEDVTLATRREVALGMCCDCNPSVELTIPLDPSQRRSEATLSKDCFLRFEITTAADRGYFDRRACFIPSAGACRLRL